MRFLRFERSTTDDIQLDQWEWDAGDVTLAFGNETVHAQGVTVIREERSHWLHSMFRRFVGQQREPSIDRIVGSFADTKSFVRRMSMTQTMLTSIDGCPAEGFVRWVKGNEFEIVCRISAEVGDTTLPFPVHVVPSANPDAR